ncbi:mitochondrial import inner membrane translocase subunit Tim21 isoform X2 [Vespa velutina]|uniref:mitochondrial import inner membrane translocase subunit Tim21 isoform X2 n=1 Tax=Vespa velutina TaxID=202808 RepID=UPI001FB3F340|nr:mitochondrial import inner membrane translocase subunit Tim21 isoform X2 [Vespa velutina]
MILLRGLTCILLRRYRITRVSNNSYFCCYNVAFNVNVKQCQWYSTKRDVTKIDSKDTKNKVSTDFVELSKIQYLPDTYNSPYGIYNRALDRCQKNTKVLDALGEPIKVYGEGRRRRNHFSHGFYEKDGTKYLRLKFYMEGIRRRGTVYVEAKNVSDNYEFTYIYMKLDDVLGSVLTIEPNEK